MRGEHLVDRVPAQVRDGIIPACAGSTRRSWTASRHPWDHPRMRGEHDGLSAEKQAQVGSSPHARGARRHDYRRRLHPGIIPACAGSTAAGRPSTPSRWDHPRMRGEHVSQFSHAAFIEGSSPHARGAHLRYGTKLRAVGIIPACAGSTRDRVQERHPERDHPRMRGEHTRHCVLLTLTTGSSPHARGALVGVVQRVPAQGIIPACAGSTPCRCSRPATSADHPRMRGEHFIFDERGRMVEGSSPHARGAPAGQDLSSDGQGIIPACAGSTCRAG